VPTVREADGLAMSSRNRFLSPEHRATAPVLLRVMTQAAAAISAGGTVTAALGEGLETLRDHGFAPDYLALVEAETLKPLDARRPDGPMRLIAAARLGTVRLLDNIAV
jgi:pantoate--beta-alanine ligase